jgi:hypothetical protein
VGEPVPAGLPGIEHRRARIDGKTGVRVVLAGDAGRELLLLISTQIREPPHRPPTTATGATVRELKPGFTG